MDDAKLALAIARGRIAIGLAALVAPGLASRALSGRKAEGIEPLLARMLGARDLTLGLGAVIALDRGAPVRGWTEGAAVSDTVDAVASLLAKGRMSPRAFTATVALASGSAALGGYLSRRLDPAPPAHPHQPEAVITGHRE
jgi:hypothetical protein